jgi:hypothetical protein
VFLKNLGLVGGALLAAGGHRGPARPRLPRRAASKHAAAETIEDAGDAAKRGAAQRPQGRQAGAQGRRAHAKLAKAEAKLQAISAKPPPATPCRLTDANASRRRRPSFECVGRCTRLPVQRHNALEGVQGGRRPGGYPRAR